MEQDSVATSAMTMDAEVMASVENGRSQRLIVADVSRDDAYITMALDDAASLPAWR